MRNFKANVDERINDIQVAIKSFMKTNYFKAKLEKNKITIKQILVLFDKKKFLFLYFVSCFN